MVASPSPSDSIEVFYSYAHEKEPLLDDLIRHLGIVKRQGGICEWHDRKLTAGSEWKGQIDRHLDPAGVILLLVSPHFGNWKDQDAFEAGFARLMEGLKAEGPTHRKTDRTRSNP